MKLYEYQAKLLFQRHNIPVPQGLVTTDAHEVRAFAERLRTPVILKAQIHITGRSQQGAILTALTPDEAFLQAEVLFGATIAGQVVRRVLVEQFIESQQRIFLALRYDRQKRQPLLAAAIEQPRKVISTARPERVFTAPIHPLRGLLTYQVHEIASHMELSYDLWQPFVNTVMQLYRFYEACDAEYVELDPLVTTSQQTIIALNGRAVIDDSAIMRQPEIASVIALESLKPPAQKARDHQLQYVPLQGQIGAVVNGAGAGMALMDMLHRASNGEIRLASFIDLQSRETVDNLVNAFHVMAAEANLKVIIVSLFSGRMNAAELARMLKQAIGQAQPSVRLVLRIEGMGAEEAQRTLRQIQGVRIATTLTDAVSIVHMLVKGRPDVDTD